MTLSRQDPSTPSGTGGFSMRRREMPAHAANVAQRRAAAGGTAFPLPRRVPSWLLWQLVLPLAAFMLASLGLMALGGDRWIAGHLYLWEGGHWALKDGFVTETLIHETGKRLSALAWLGVVAAAIVAWRRPALRAWCRPLLCLAASVLVATTVVAWMKSWTDVDCPWDLLAYGGTRDYHALLAAMPANAPMGRCFPAGHASAGYAWVALYFFFAGTRPQWRWAGLGVGLGAGLVFGISQQLRGAHFMSHDVWTLVICWLAALLLHRAFAARGFARIHGARAAAPSLSAWDA
jgi:membrane-associated PAP2 superfamily phosphatase